jgi:DNA-binding MarR family transcriptional regulator
MGANSPPDLSKLADIDRAIHEPARAAIMAVLYGVDSADFRFLLRTTQLTKGNLSVHARKLEAAEYLSIEKSFQNNYPRTEYRLTQKGRKAFRAYVKKLKSLSDALEE